MFSLNPQLSSVEHRKSFFKSETIRHLWTPYNDVLSSSGLHGLGCISYKETVLRGDSLRPIHHVLHTGRGVGIGAVVHIAMEDEDLTIDGNVISTKPYGTGHIQNKSFRGVTAAILVNLEFIDLQDISSEIISLFREVLH